MKEHEISKLVHDLRQQAVDQESEGYSGDASFLAAHVIEILADKAGLAEYEAVWEVLNNGSGDTNDVLKAARQARLARIKL